MCPDNYIEAEIADKAKVQKFVENIEAKESELVLTSAGHVVGAVLTSAQYEWFLDKLDEDQDVAGISEKSDDLDGSQSLDDFKNELGV